MRLRPLEIKVSVNYALLSINIVRLANLSNYAARGRGAGALRDFNPAYVRFGSKSEELELSISGPLLPSKADIIADVSDGRVVPQAAVSRCSKATLIRSPRPRGRAATAGSW